MQQDLRATWLEEPDRRHLEALGVAPRRDRSVQWLPLSAVAFLLWQMRDLLQRPLVCVTDGQRTLDQLADDLHALAAGRDGSTACLPDPGLPPHADLVGDRMRVLRACVAGQPPAITVATVQGLLSLTSPPDLFQGALRSLNLGDEVDLQELAEHLEEIGYHFEAQVAEKGHAAHRGGLLDVWPVTEPLPVRVEFFGSTVDTIRTFNPEDQRSVDRRQRLDLGPAAETFPARPTRRRSVDITSYISEDTVWVWYDPPGLMQHAALHAEAAAADELISLRSLRGRVRRHAISGSLEVGPDRVVRATHREIGLAPAGGLPSLTRDAAAPDVLARARGAFLDDLAGRAARQEQVLFCFATEGGRDRFLEMDQAPSILRSPERVTVARLSEGFHAPQQGLTVVAESDLYGSRKLWRSRPGAAPGQPRRKAGPRVTTWTELDVGEHVVHVDHGIGKYLGLHEIRFKGQLQEVLAIEYDDGARLYLPVSHAHLLSRYVGMGGRTPRLHKLGGRRWHGEKRAAQRAVRDMAASLLETQATRNTRTGYAFAEDGHWQHEFEAAFPYEETADQTAAIEQVKDDMERPRPMDRLICGDVGYGKTEVAMRAAFKAVMSGKQVAVLVPTTILAQQHFETFSTRMAAYPVSVGVLSRFETKQRQQETLRGLREGSVDIVIGTHRLIQSDVQIKDLGLLIIDEEQRFGVAQKEYLKQLRNLVDVLTLTATPIPRTLYMSLLGAKDMSTIQTAPRERLPVETVVVESNDEVIRAAILRELNREGQVFFLHNRVVSIDRMHQRLQRLVPEARIAVGHGQMHERELAAVMRDFVRGSYDVLLCTTIIESGVDIPNVNTILIDRADRFGVADLYQLRGRVGRYKNKAYAYLLLPRHGRLFDVARQRIGAIRRHTSLGSGFKLAMKDLEIRGAGNLLGAEQSGHIAAVGFDLYCQLLRRTVAVVRGEAPPVLAEVEMKLDFLDYATGHAGYDNAAVLPAEYIEDENLRVGAYHRIAACTRESEVDEVEAELTDRFGPVPPALHRLLTLARVRCAAAAEGITRIETRDDKVMMSRQQEYLMFAKRFPRFQAPDPDGKLEELLVRARAPSRENL